MKKILLPLFLMLTIFLFACRNGADKKASTAEVEINVEQIEQESKSLEETAQEIENKEAALEAALKELE